MDKYIEREAALSVIRELNTPAKSPAQKDMLRTASVYIQAIPAADVATVAHGRWVEWYPPKHMILTGEEMLYRCSSCDAKYSDVEGFRFCPNCGAKMDAEG